MHEISFRYAAPLGFDFHLAKPVINAVLPLFVSEKLLSYYSLSFRLKGVKTNTLEAIHHRDTECTEENFFIVKNHKLLFTTEVTLSHPYNRDISACTSHRGKHLYCFKSEDIFIKQCVK